MKRTAVLTCLPLLVACVPEYNPEADVSLEDVLEDVECEPLPASIGVIDYPTAEEREAMTETGYDHRGGIPGTGDEGVIHHEAYLVRNPEASSYTMLSFQDFRGEGPVRSGGEEYSLFVEGERDIDSYKDCAVCVLFLMGCPRESLGGCERQFLAVRGTLYFDEFEKTDEWTRDTLERLSVRLADLEFKEVHIDPVSYDTAIPDHVCPGEHCHRPGLPAEECFAIRSYSFSYVAGE